MNKKLIDFLILSVSAWAVVATSQMRTGYDTSITVGTFAIESDCEGDTYQQGTLKLERLDSSYYMAREIDIVLPSYSIEKEKSEDEFHRYKIEGLTMVCTTILDEELFDAGDIVTFACNRYEGPACSIKMELKSLEEENQYVSRKPK